VTRFLAGFALASLVWGGLGAYLVIERGYGPPDEEIDGPPELATADAPVDDTATTTTTRRPRRRRGTSGSSGSSGSTAPSTGSGPTGDATTGDDLGEPPMRIIDGAGSGGEEQLTGAEIDHAFDGAMPRIRRCFILAATDQDLTGRLVFGLRIGGNGHVNAVNLAGPAVLTTGDSGDCLRTAARAMTFPTFDGPEMVIRYPITLE
jgi:hypothetical protein